MRDKYIDSWKHHHNQDSEDIHHPVPLCFFAIPPTCSSISLSPNTHWSAVTRDEFASSRIYIKGLRQYAFAFVWLSSPIMMHLRLIHAVAFGSFSLPSSIPFDRAVIHLFVFDGHLFPVWGYCKAAMNIPVHVFVWRHSYSSWANTWMEWLCYMASAYLT